MKLECKLRRAGGTDVDLPPHIIQFRPLDPTRADSPHVAEVDEETAARLMAADGNVYVPYRAGQPAAKLPPPPLPKEPQPFLYGSSTLPAQVDLGNGMTMPLGEVVKQAYAASGLSMDEWNGMEEAARDDYLNRLIAAVRSDSQKAPQAPQPSPTAPPAAAESTTPPQVAGDKADSNGDGALSVRELKAGIADGSLTPERLRELMAQEEASAQPRDSFIAVIVKALK